MSFAEFAFLAAGLVLGAAGGIATAARFLGVERRREVRVTITPDAVPRRRAATLAGDPFADAGRPATVGVAAARADAPGVGLATAGVERRPDVARTVPGATEDRTGVHAELPGRVAVPIIFEPDPLLAELRASAPAATEDPELVAGGSSDPEEGIASPVLVASGAAAGALDARASATSRSAAGVGRGWARIVEPAAPSAPPGLGGSRRESFDAERGARADGGPPSGVDDGCRDLELEADEQCRLAEAARLRVEELAAEVVAADAQRDRQAEVARAAEAGDDAARMAAARAAARAAFQSARERATSAADIDEAARAWLAQIDALSREAAEAQASLERLQASVEIATATSEHLAAELEAARSAAEAGDVACLYARRRAAECAGADLAASDADVVDTGAGHDAEPRDGAEDAAGTTAGRTPTVPATGSRPIVLRSRAEDAGPRPAIERVLSGEHEVLDQIVARIADDAEGRRHWGERLTALLEAILLAAVDSAAVDVPADDPFWSTFTAEQSRDILAALASLGHHFDGLGGWLDDRAPDQRDLSLAVAHAGLDPMRIRRWPTNAESAVLLRDAVILGADYLAAVAPGLAVEELTAVLGREGRALADVWAEWERIRPALAAID